MTSSLPYNLLPSIYNASIDSNLWIDALNQIVPEIGAKTSALVSFETIASNSYNLGIASGLFTPNITKQYQSEFAHHDSHIFPLVAATNPGELIFDPLMQKDIKKYMLRPDVDFLLRKLGVLYRVGMRLTEDPSRLDCITFQFDQKRGNISNSESSKLIFLYPHLGTSIQQTKTFDLLNSRYRAVLTVLDRVRVPLVLTLENGHVLIKNRMADVLLDQSRSIKIGSDGKIEIPDKSLHSMLLNAIKRTSTTAEGRDNTAARQMVVPNGIDDNDFVVDIYPLRDGTDELGMKYSGSLLTIIDPNIQHVLDLSPIRAVYGLTKSELEITSHIVHGLEYNDIADLRNVSTETVRTQIKSIYKKTNTKNRSFLVHRILSILLPIDLTL